jgi:hypothetical protein
MGLARWCEVESTGGGMLGGVYALVGLTSVVATGNVRPGRLRPTRVSCGLFGLLLGVAEGVAGGWYLWCGRSRCVAICAEPVDFAFCCCQRLLRASKLLTTIARQDERIGEPFAEAARWCQGLRRFWKCRLPVGLEHLWRDGERSWGVTFAGHGDLGG